MSKPKPQLLRGSHIDAQELFAGWVVLSNGWVTVEGKSSCHFRTNNLPRAGQTQFHQKPGVRGNVRCSLILT